MIKRGTISVVLAMLLTKTGGTGLIQIGLAVTLSLLMCIKDDRDRLRQENELLRAQLMGPPNAAKAPNGVDDEVLLKCLKLAWESVPFFWNRDSQEGSTTTAFSLKAWQQHAF